MNFNQEVIEKSYHRPVVVDFWAPWCGPCRILSPVIEQIADEQAGEWELVKINTEEHPEIADENHIRSIPSVKMFYRGEVIQEFMGALPRQMILDWLRKSLPQPGLMALDQLLSSVAEPSADDLKKLFEEYPESEEIRLVYAQLVIWDDPALAHQLVEPIKFGSPLHDKASFLRDIIAFLLSEGGDENISSIRKLLLNSRIEEAMPSLLSVLATDADALNGVLARAAIGIFNLLGNQHPLTKQYRRQLDMYLWK